MDKTKTPGRCAQAFQFRVVIGLQWNRPTHEFVGRQSTHVVFVDEINGVVRRVPRFQIGVSGDVGDLFAGRLFGDFADFAQIVCIGLPDERGLLCGVVLFRFE